MYSDIAVEIAETEITPGLRHAHRETYLHKTAERDRLLARLEELEFEIEVSRSWLDANDAEWVASHDELRDAREAGETRLTELAVA